MTVRSSLLVLAATSLAALSCSDPPPTPPRAAVEINLSPPGAVPGLGTRNQCTATETSTYRYFLGKAGLPGMGKDKVLAGMVEHGHGLSASCTVRDLGGGRFSVSANVSGVETNNRRLWTSVTLNGTLSASGPAADNVASVAFFSSTTENLRTISELPGCTIGPVYKVLTGALHADFSCPVLADSSDPSKGCQATGSIAIDRCRTGKEED